MFLRDLRFGWRSMRRAPAFAVVIVLTLGVAIGAVALALAGLAAGLVAGVGVAAALGRVFPGGPNGDGRTDVFAFVVVASIVLAATLLAAFVPARRVLKIDPTVALRAE
jgi:ABC-type antimicrobial peptide transport system permease subunit